MNTVHIRNSYSSCGCCRYIQFYEASEVLPNGYYVKGNPDWCLKERREIKDVHFIPDWCPLKLCDKIAEGDK